MGFLPFSLRTRVRIQRLPPTCALEGIDLRPYRFVTGQTYDLNPDVARVLLLWEYAVLANGESPDQDGHGRVCAKCGLWAFPVGQSDTPPLIHFHCNHCGHITSQPLT